MPMRRAAYVAALQRERAAVTSRATVDEIRLAAIDAELDQYAEAPLEPSIERAVPGPISRSRVRGARRDGVE